MAEDDVFGGEEGEGEASSSGSRNIFMSAFPVWRLVFDLTEGSPDCLVNLSRGHLLKGAQDREKSCYRLVALGTSCHQQSRFAWMRCRAAAAACFLAQLLGARRQVLKGLVCDP